MYCNACGRSIASDANYCDGCGKQVAGRQATRSLKRPLHNKVIAGVCAAFGNYFDLDGTVVRVLWVLAVVFAGTGILAYLLCWIVIPKEPEYLPPPVPSQQQTA